MNIHEKIEQLTETPDIDTGRRSFLGAMAAAAGVTLAPGVMLYGI